MSGEQWRSVTGYEGLYIVSDRGRVRALARTIPHSRGRSIRYLAERDMAIRTTPTGYQRVALQHEGQRRDYYVHRLVALAFLGPPQPGQEVCHNDGNPQNNCVANLRWDTHSANMLEAVAAGTHSKTSRQQCPRGHDLRAPNLKASQAALGYRACLACDRARKVRCPLPGEDVQAIADRYYAQLMKEVQLHV